MSEHLRPSPLALATRSGFAVIQSSFPHILPRHNRPGAWLGPRERKVLHQATDTRFFNVYSLPDLWHDWDTVLFTAQYGPANSTNDLRLVRRVERWSPQSLLIFACDEVEQFLHWHTGPHPQSRRLTHVIDAIRRSAHGGRHAVDEVSAARADAQAVYEGMTAPVGSVHDMTSEELWELGANDLALAVLLLASPDRRGDSVGTSARKAVLLARQSACRGPGGHIGARLLGRRHHAELMRFLRVGTNEERNAVSEGKAPVAGAVWAQNAATFEIVDLLHEE